MELLLLYFVMQLQYYKHATPSTGQLGDHGTWLMGQKFSGTLIYKLPELVVY